MILLWVLADIIQIYFHVAYKLVVFIHEFLYLNCVISIRWESYTI